MYLTFYTMVLFFGCIMFLHVFHTTAQDSSADAIVGSVRITSTSNPYNSNTFSSNIQQAIPSISGTSSNQQLIPTFFSASATSATASSGLLPPGLVPNAFARAVLTLPILQRFSTLRFSRLQGANLLFNAVFDAVKSLGSPIAETIANIVGQTIAGLDYFSIPLYFYIKGNSVEKFLISEGVEITPGLVQLYKNSMEKAFESSVLNSKEALLSAIQHGYIIFIQSIGYRFIEKAYILALIFHEEAIATIDALKP